MAKLQTLAGTADETTLEDSQGTSPILDMPYNDEKVQRNGANTRSNASIDDIMGDRLASRFGSRASNDAESSVDGDGLDTLQDVLAFLADHRKLEQVGEVMDPLPTFPEETLDIKGIEYKLDIYQRMYLLLDEPTSCSAATKLSLFITFLVLLSCTVFVLETHPGAQSWVGECAPCAPVPDIFDGASQAAIDENEMLKEARRNYTATCLRLECKPEATEILFVLEALCVVIFTIEFFSRWYLATTFPSTTEFKVAVKIERPYVMPQGPKRYFWRAGLFLTSVFNVIDILSIVPFWLDVMFGGAVPLTFLRLLRLLRILRVLRVMKLPGRAQNIASGVVTITEVIVESGSFLIALLIFTVCAMILYASLVFIFEQGTLNHETGRYYIENSHPNLAPEESMFISIPQCFWWVLVSFTTVGYGDMYPKSDMGRLIGTVTMYTGIMFIALPLTIIGGKFSEMYQSALAIRQEEDEKRRNCLRIFKKHLVEAAQENSIMSAMFHFRTWKAHAKKATASQSRDVTLDNIREVVAEVLNSDSLGKASLFEPTAIVAMPSIQDSSAPAQFAGTALNEMSRSSSPVLSDQEIGGNGPSAILSLDTVQRLETDIAKIRNSVTDLQTLISQVTEGQKRTEAAINEMMARSETSLA